LLYILSLAGVIMCNRRIDMKQIKRVLKKYFNTDYSKRRISRETKVSRESVTNYICRADAAKLTLSDVERMSEIELERKLFPPISNPKKQRPQPNYGMVYVELKRKGATLQALHNEYLIEFPNGIFYASFCEGYRKYKKSLRRYMRQDYKAGEKVFVDYCGPTVNITNPKTGEIKTAQIFVGVLGASNYIYADATWSQKVGHWVMSHAKMFEFFGGVPEVVVCDNLKSAVTKVSRTDPIINNTYQAMADHYDTAIFAARPYKPKDKSKAENGVLIIERWILFRIRKIKFTSLHQLNQEILKLLKDVNNRPFQKLEGSRTSLFESLDKPVLKQLPLSRYTYTEYRKIRADFGYHISISDHAYSVPEALSGIELDVHINADVIEVFHKGARVCSHLRSYERGRTTDPNHMPDEHRHLAEFTEEKALQWGLELGQATHKFIQSAIKEARRRDDSYRLLNGMKKLELEYGQERIENACAKCLGIGGTKLQNIRSILKTNLDRTIIKERKIHEADFEHQNIRGSDYYH